jgi:hypothetical protein
MDLRTFLIILSAFTGAAVTIIGVIVLAIGHVRRQAGGVAPGQLSPEEIEDLRARLADLERREGRVEEIAERLDFVERMLGQAREAKALPQPSDQA